MLGSAKGDAMTTIFRLFVSSTFADFREERETLRQAVWPRLHRLCAEHGARFQPVDLRWGGNRAAAEDQRAMEICLQEIHPCPRVTTRPNFVALVGERYGWCPLPS